MRHYYKPQKNFRLTTYSCAVLEALQWLTGEDQTKILEECLRIGKKTYARTRSIDKDELSNHIEMFRNAIIKKQMNKKAAKEISDFSQKAANLYEDDIPMGPIDEGLKK